MSAVLAARRHHQRAVAYRQAQKNALTDWPKRFICIFYPMKGLRAFDFAGTQATCTNILVLGCAVNHNFDLLQIRFPNSFAMFVGVRNGIAGDNAFFAYKAFLSHYFNLPYVISIKWCVLQLCHKAGIERMTPMSLVFRAT